MKREVWQEYDCPTGGIDFDLFDGDMVYRGQPFRCSCCGQTYFAGIDVRVDTNVRVGDESAPLWERETSCVPLPETAEELQRLRDGA